MEVAIWITLCIIAFMMLGFGAVFFEILGIFAIVHIVMSGVSWTLHRLFVRD